MLERLTINLSEIERQALQEVAKNELRDMRDQVRFIVRQELERRGLLQPSNQAPGTEYVPGDLPPIPRPN